MSTLSSPARFAPDFDGIYDPNFTVDISNRMRVPRRIRVTGNDDDVATDFSRPAEHHKLEMTVPGRILVTGQDTHVGLKSPPRELHLERSMLPPPSLIRVQTPPRVLTLEEHPFPTVDEIEQEMIRTKHASGNEVTHTNTYNATNPAMDQSLSSYPSSPPTVGPGGDSLTSSGEELMLFRRHLAKLSRRVMVLEHENHQRQQREVIIYSIGVAYFFLKTLYWLHRHW